MSDNRMEQARELVRQQGVLRPRDLVVRGLPASTWDVWRGRASSNA